MAKVYAALACAIINISMALFEPKGDEDSCLPGTTATSDDWESARRRSLVRGLSVSPTERVAWLEEMIRIAWASGALPHPRTELGERLDRTSIAKTAPDTNG